MRREETVDHHIKTAWHAIARMYNQQAVKYDGTMAMGLVLLTINSEEGTPATKIAPLMGLEARSLTRLLKTLEERSLIFRETDPSDKRLALVRLTSEGKVMRESAREKVLRFNQVVRDHIPNEKLEVFFQVIQQITQLVENNKVYEKQKAN